jgi:membrane protease subunit HflK
MAWNEPGRNRNPWGNRPDRGAADLDEVLRNLQRRLAGLLGGGRGGDAGGGGGGGGGRGAAMRGFGFGTVLLVLLAIWMATGLYKVDGRWSRASASTRPRPSPGCAGTCPGRSRRAS